MSEDNELRDVVLQDYKELKGRIEALEKALAEDQTFFNQEVKGEIAELKEVLLKHLQECGDPLWEKLDSPTLPDPYYACGKEKTEKRESFLPENYYSGGEK